MSGLHRFALPVGALFVLGLAAPLANAQSFTGNGFGSGSGNPVSSTAEFAFGSGVLTVVVKNTSPFDYLATPNGSRALPTDVLTGIFFDYAGGFGPPLAFNSATAPAVSFGANPVNLKLSLAPGGWDYLESASSLNGLTQHYGLGTAGFNIFDGATSSGGPGHGSNYGIMNNLFANGESNAALLNTPFAIDEIAFSFSVGAFDVTKVGNVRFQYGTALNEGFTVGNVPEPASLSLMASSLPALALARWLRRRKATAPLAGSV